jgi:hypothetical protein
VATPAHDRESVTALGSLDELIEIAIDGAPVHRSARFGPIPLELYAEDEHQRHELVMHLACADTPIWRPLTVVDITSATLPIDALPPVLRPELDDQRIARFGDRVVLSSGSEAALWVLDPSADRAVRWIDDRDDVPVWERICPLRLAGRWWAAEHGAALIHAGVVGDADGAVLLVGTGGAGKSTTTMACFGNGLDVLGDDHAFLIPPSDGGPAVVHAAHRLAKLDDASLAMLPHLRAAVVGEGMRGKSLVELTDVVPAHRPVRAVCHVVQDRSGPTHLRPLSRVDALRAAAPSSMFQVRMFERETWTPIADTVRAVPCFSLSVADPADAPAVLAGLLDDLRAERAAS